MPVITPTSETTSRRKPRVRWLVLACLPLLLFLALGLLAPVFGWSLRLGPVGLGAYARKLPPLLRRLGREGGFEDSQTPQGLHRSTAYALTGRRAEIWTFRIGDWEWWLSVWR